MPLYANVSYSNGVANISLPRELTDPVLNGIGLDLKIEKDLWRLTPNPNNTRNTGTDKAGKNRQVSARGVPRARRFQYRSLPLPDFRAQVVPIAAEGEDLVLRGLPTGITFEAQLQKLLS